VLQRPRTRLLAVATCGALLLLAVPSALGQSLYNQRDQVNEKIAGLRDQIAADRYQEGVLSGEIASATAQIESLEADIGALSARIAVLEGQLAEHRERLEALKALFAEQTADLNHLKRQYALAQRQLEERLVSLYQEGDEAQSLEILLRVQTLGELLDQLEYFGDVGRQDQAIAAEIKQLRNEMHAARERTRDTKAKVAEATAALAQKTAEQIAVRDELVAQQTALAAAREAKSNLLVGVREERHEAEENLGAMEAESAALGAQIREAEAAAAAAAAEAAAAEAAAEAEEQAESSSSGGGSSSSSAGTVSSSGFIWPVSGIVTSGYGMRWGSLHAGVDIAAPYGTPVQAAASGTVVSAGSMGGYGNIVVIVHGNGLATAYAHMSAIYVGGGSVSQGQTIGAVGSTGHSTGNHLHFEVRVNGSPVDPLGYL
jgi:murein DD-endopeptidase MepM/ murein hydrolase activator NlpD